MPIPKKIERDILKLESNDPKLVRMSLKYELFDCNYADTIEVITAVAKALKKNSNLEGLSIPEACIRCKGMIILAEALLFNNAVEEIHLDLNEIGDKGTKALADAIEHSTSLQNIDLRGNSFGEEGLIAIGNSLRLNSSLEIFLLERNKMGYYKAGFEVFGEGLRCNRTLTRLNLNNNAIDCGCAKILSRALKENDSIKELELDRNLIGDEGIKYLGEALSTNSTLESLSLSSNEFTHDGAKALGESLIDNPFLQRLDLSGNCVIVRRLGDIFPKSFFFPIPLYAMLGDQTEYKLNADYFISRNLLYGWRPVAREKITTGEHKGRFPLHIAAEKGLDWTNGMKEIFEANPTLLEEQDTVTGLYPFMLAASSYGGGGNDTDSVFELLKGNPTLISEFDNIPTEAHSESGDGSETSALLPEDKSFPNCEARAESDSETKLLQTLYDYTGCEIS